MENEDKIVAVSFLTLQEWKRWGNDMEHIFPLPADNLFDDLLQRLDLVPPGPEAQRHPAKIGLSCHNTCSLCHSSGSWSDLRS